MLVFMMIFLKLFSNVTLNKIYFLQIDVLSAGNIKRIPSEKADDPESEDEFGYTHSKN